MKPKLLVVLNYFFPYISGVSEAARNLARALSDEFDITILAGRHAAGLSDEEMIDGLRVVRATTLFHLHKGYLSADFVALFRRLAAQSDVIHLHVPMLEAALFARIGRKYAPVVISYHCDVIPTGGLVDWLAVKSVLLSCRAAAKQADAIVVHTKDYALGSRVLVGLDNKLIEIPPINKMERRPLQSGPRRDAFNIGFVGRFVREKGIDVILEVIDPVCEHIHDARFRFVGETRDVAGGSIYDSISGRLARHVPRVELLGRLSEDELWDVYATLDVLLLPSVNCYEAFGLVQVDAMLAGALVVASNMRGVRAPINLTGNGRLVQPGSVGSLFEAIVACHSLQRKLSREQIRARTLQHFRNEAVLQRFGATLTSLINSRQPKAMAAL